MTLTARLARAPALLRAGEPRAKADMIAGAAIVITVVAFNVLGERLTARSQARH